MDFYKKIIKNKDVSGLLSEKEYKCASLQAITNEALKENNKERLKDLVEEINGHLTDLRAIKDDKDAKNKEKCDKLIHQFEECLVKILNKKPSENVLTILNQKMNELQLLSNVAVQENKIEELKKLVEKIERNLEVVKEMPEVKNAKNTDNGVEFSKLVAKYEDLLKVINAHISATRKVISEPMAVEAFQEVVQGDPQEQDNITPKPSKIGLNEVEEKLKLMRQKRLNRLSTFVDQQSKLSEQRSRENSPKNTDNANKSLENLSKISESVESETAIKSIQSPEIVKPPTFWPIAREKLVKPPGQKVFQQVDDKVIKRLEPKVKTSEFHGGNGKAGPSFKIAPYKSENIAMVNDKPVPANAVVTGLQAPEQKVSQKVDEKVIKRLEPKVQTSGYQAGIPKAAGSFKTNSYKSENSAVVSEKQFAANAVVTGTPTKEFPKPGDKKLGKALKEDDITSNRTSAGNMTENVGSAGENVVSSVRNSFGKGTLTRSFAERQIENAKMQAASEKPKVQLKQSNSTRTTPPRTPTQIRKIFNSFNACVLGTNNSKSIEDLPREFNSPFGQELKTVQLKSTGFDYKAEQPKSIENSFRSNISEVSNADSSKAIDIPPPIVPRRAPISSGNKSDFARSRAFGQNEFENYSEVVKPLERRKVDVENLDIPKLNTTMTEDLTPVKITAPQGKIKKSASEYYNITINRSNENITPKTDIAKRRLSLDFDSAIVREHASNYLDPNPTDLLITVKRDSNTIPNESLDRYSFSTFRASTGSLKNENSVENPLYGVITADRNSKEHSKDNTNSETSKYNTSEKAFKELIINCNSLKDLIKTLSNKELRQINYINNVKELNVLLKEVTRNVEATLDNDDESKKENKQFARFFNEILNIENAIKSFKGLKRDSEYLLIDKQLAKYFVEIDQIRPQSPTDRNEKKCLKERLKTANKNLGEKVTRNEEILKSVLEEQVMMLVEKYKII